MAIELAISPLELDSLTRMYWGHWDAYAISQLAPLARRTDCYQPKFYKAPASNKELLAPFQTAEYGLQITPGSLIYGFLLPAEPSTGLPASFNVQIRDEAMKHEFWDAPVPSIFLANYKPTYLTANPLATEGEIASFPSLLPCPHPVTGDGIFLVKIWNGPDAQRVELVFGVLEVKQCL